KKEDPVVHFYETFLAAYDSKLRQSRGVYYTPEPVVSFIVRSLDSILKKSFRRTQGLADSKTHILDPACGTGTFLYSVIKLIYDKMEKAGQKGVWNEYVDEHLLKRVFGFELLMAPYTVAHLKLGLLLQETGYKFDSDQRLGIYLTNTLSEAEHKDLPLFAQFIAEESAQAARVKNEVPIMVILGNPPYSGISANIGEWITKLIDDYKFIDGKPLNERKLWLQDDYVKFIRFAQWKIDRTSQGVVGMITNHAYLDNPTFRGMRQSLLNTYSEIYILNLHGNAKKKEKCPDGSKDENVFDIQQGVAISLFVKKQKSEGQAKVYYADLWGTRDSKYKNLSEDDINKTNYKELSPDTPYYFFIPRNEEGRSEYEKYWKITDIFPVNCTGIVTARDKFVIDFEKDPLKERIECFRDKTFSDVEIKEKFKLSENYAWRVSKARADLTSVENWRDYFDKLLYRPFDTRNIYYHPTVVWRVREKVMRHMIFGNNVAFYLCRQLSGNIWRHILATNNITDDCYVSNKTKERGYIFPLYLYPDEKQKETELKRQPNIKPEFIKEVSEKLKLEFISDGQGDLKKTFGPEDIFYYIYAVFHSPEYRKRYAEFLKIDFPRVPLTSDRELFRKLAEKGKELVSLHLMESLVLEKLITRFPIPGKNEVVKVNYVEAEKRIYINKDQYFEGIEYGVWNFHIGGYQVLDKWLKSRKGRLLTFDEVLHWQKIVVVLKETAILMTEIDQTIPQWPIK
ncbi:N-6 DNA methylase, partial [bacterium]|nr:N-6 DNA methylase [bacterium]